MKSKFLGDTKGNRDLNHNLTQGGGGGGESHSKGPSGKFVGPGRGNKVGPKVDRSSGVGGRGKRR